MATVMQAVEQLRGRGHLPVSGAVSIKSLHQRFQPNPRTSVRALIASMFDRVSAKRPWAVILCRFKGAPPNPAREAPIEKFYRAVFTPGTGGLVEFWRDASLGMIDIRGSRVFGWVEIDIPRDKANTGSGVARSRLIDAAIDATRRHGYDPTNGFHRQIAVYTENWSIDGVPAGLDWSDLIWGKYWIDGSADGGGRVCLTPPHNGNVTAHEMGHGFGMNHDLGADDAGMLVRDYADPCCIMSQNNPFTHPTWSVAFGPALCIPHLVKQGWMYPRRLYYDSGAWQRRRSGITLLLAQITDPIARANLGIKLAYSQGEKSWDYYIEYVRKAGWNAGLPKPAYVFIRRLAPHASYGETPAYLSLIEVPTTFGVKAEVVEPSGNVLFQVEWFDAAGRILRMNARKL